VSTLPPPLVLVRGVVYRLLDRSARPLSNPRPKYVRASVPPDVTPGKRSKWPAAYAPHRLPIHDVIDEAKAREVMDASVAYLRPPAAEHQARLASGETT
jgi:hypothetical protein